jgi:hypothetical protein
MGDEVAYSRQKRRRAQPAAMPETAGPPKPKADFRAITLQHNAHFRDKRCQKRRQRAPKTAPLAPRGPRDREPLFLGLWSQMPQILLALSFTTFAGPKYRKPKMGPHDLRAWSFEDGCLCSILHGLLQLQIWTAFLLPARLFLYCSTPIGHTTFSHNLLSII